jgi:hypothetical protein
MQSVACFEMSDGDRVLIFWLAEERKLKLTSDQEPRYDTCRERTVRRTIYWALGDDPETSDRELRIHSLVCKHAEILLEGEPWKETCTAEQCVELLDHDWESYAANGIFLSFVVDG